MKVKEPRQMQAAFEATFNSGDINQISLYEPDAVLAQPGQRVARLAAIKEATWPAHNREGHRCSQPAVRRAVKRSFRELQTLRNTFRYFSRERGENSASRASLRKFIGRSGRDFRCGRAHLDRFGLRIMNPPL